MLARRSLSFVLVTLLSPIVASAQSTATLNGRVLDEGGAVLPGVTVVVTNVGTGIGNDGVAQRPVD